MVRGCTRVSKWSLQIRVIAGHPVSSLSALLSWALPPRSSDVLRTFSQVVEYADLCPGEQR